MPDTVKDPLDGPDRIYSTDLKPTRGDWHTLAVLALKVLSLSVPRSRYKATVLAVRLHRRLAETSSSNNTPNP